MKTTTNSLVIGAGIVGICTALHLQRRGRRVTLVDRQGPGEGTSSGNAGIISTGSVRPEAMPGIWRDIPEIVLQPMAPVTLRPAYLPRFLPWFTRFLRNSSPDRAEASSIAIHGLTSQAFTQLKLLAEGAGALDLLRSNGELYVYESASQFARAQADCAYYDRRGVDYELVDSRGLRELEPALNPRFAGGVLVPHAGHTVSPLALSRALFAHFQSQGGDFINDDITGFDCEGRVVTAAMGSSPHDCEEVFITCGSWSHHLAAKLGSRVPLDTERGYHQHLPDPGVTVSRPILFTGRAFAATTMADGLRLAGTVEFAGLKAAPDYRRAEALAAQARELFPDINIEGGRPWMGYRPSLPDSVPVVSASPHFSNAYFGFGHGHLGLTLSAVSGAMLAAMAVGDSVPVDPAAYRIDRRF